MMSIIKVSNLSKSYRTFARREGVWGGVKDLVHRDYKTLKAVDDISFSVQPGELLGYIGPNGAGKSTSIKMLTGILKPSAGDIDVMSFNPFKDRKVYTKHIGVVFGQRTQLWWDIAVIESFTLLARIYEVSRKELDSRLEVLDEILDLKPVLRTPVRKLSLGQRMRCDLAASLIHEPKILFLDEPTIGLDAVAKDNVRKFLRHINKEFKTTIILTTHDMREIEELCERVVIIDKGHVIYDGLLDSIKLIPGLEYHISVDFIGDTSVEDLNALFNNRVSFEKKGERRLVATYDRKKLPTVDLIRTIMCHHEVSDLALTEPSIEEVVMKIYKEGIG